MDALIIMTAIDTGAIIFSLFLFFKKKLKKRTTLFLKYILTRKQKSEEPWFISSRGRRAKRRRGQYGDPAISLFADKEKNLDVYIYIRDDRALNPLKKKMEWFFSFSVRGPSSLFFSLRKKKDESIN